MMISLNLLVLRAHEPQRLADFYSGFGLHFDQERHGSGPVHYCAKAGETLIEIYPRTGGNNGTSEARLGFSTPCLDAAIDVALKGNGRLISGPSRSCWGYRAVLQDPEGHKIELVEDDPRPGTL
jgi:lactoylglutathione lyase